MLTYKKVYIDSAHRISGTSSNFRVELPETLQTDNGVHCYIHEVTLPNSWYSIQSGLNNILYFYSSPLAPDEDNTNVHYLALQLDEGVYTGTELATELKAKINGVVDNTNFSNTYEFFYSVKTNKITIYSNYADRKFAVLTDEQMKLTYADYIWNGSFDVNNLHSVNEVLGNYQMVVYQYNNPYVSGFVNLQPIRNIYIHSSQLSNYNQVNLRTGDSTVVKKVPVTAPHAGIVFDSELNPLDYLDVSNRSFKQLDFWVSNSLGNEINLNGVNVSLSLLFVKSDII